MPPPLKVYLNDFDAFVHLCNHDYNQDIEHFYVAKKSPNVPFQGNPHSWPQATTDLLPLTTSV